MDVRTSAEVNPPGTRHPDHMIPVLVRETVSGWPSLLSALSVGHPAWRREPDPFVPNECREQTFEAL